MAPVETPVTMAKFGRRPEAASPASRPAPQAPPAAPPEMARMLNGSRDQPERGRASRRAASRRESSACSTDRRTPGKPGTSAGASGAGRRTRERRRPFAGGSAALMRRPGAIRVSWADGGTAAPAAAILPRARACRRSAEDAADAGVQIGDAGLVGGAGQGAGQALGGGELRTDALVADLDVRIGGPQLAQGRADVHVAHGRVGLRRRLIQPPA